MDNRIKNVISAVMGLPLEQVLDSASVETVPQWDSLKHLTLVLALEEEFQIRFSDQEIHSLTNYQAVRGVVTSKCQEQAGTQ